MYIESLKKLFSIKYHEKGSMYRPAEEQTYINYVDFLDECEGTGVHYICVNGTCMIYISLYMSGGFIHVCICYVHGLKLWCKCIQCLCLFESDNCSCTLTDYTR